MTEIELASLTLIEMEVDKEALLGPDTQNIHDEEQAEPIPYKAPQRNITRLILTSTVFILAAFVAFIVYRSTRTTQRYGCGSTPEEARAKGCHFELTGSSWLHKDCYDPETEAEFLAFNDWHFFSDSNYTQEVPLSEVRKGNGHGYYVTQEYHGTHCAFLMKKFHKAVSEGRKRDGMISPLHHTSHCIQWLLDPPMERWDKPQFAYTKYPYCGRSGGYNVDIAKPWTWTD